LAGLVGVVFLSVSPKIPHLDHFRSLLDFGKFSWLGSLSGRVFNQVDVLVLGVFVSPALVGVYSIAWNLTSFIGAFGSSIQQSTFPELSRASAEERLDMVGDVVTDSIAFTGLLAIPGLFGGVLLGDRILRLYGEEFVQGTAVLGLLILAMLIWDYMNQLLTTLNAIDRPDLAFRVNAVFVVLNVVLNVALVFRFGWVGAAVATVASTTVGLLLAFHYLRGLVGFSVPVFELGRQVAAGLMMAVVVSSVRRGIEVFDLLNHNAATVAILVTLGAAAYFLALAAISDRFRATLRDNAPVELPFH
jgi:O-antigen/teichoic acid export membrane protein